MCLMAYMEDEAGMSLAIAMLVRWTRLGKCDMRSRNRRTTYNVHNIYKDIFEQFEHIADINFHIINNNDEMHIH
jgi:hypothetical protein